MLWKPRNIPDQPSTNPKRTSTIWSETCVTCVPPRMVQMEFTKLTWSRSIHETQMTNDTLIHFVVNLCPCFFVVNAPCWSCYVSLPGYIFVIWSNFSFQISLLQTYQFLGDDNFAARHLIKATLREAHTNFPPGSTTTKRSPKCSPSKIWLMGVMSCGEQLTWFKDELLLFTSSTSNIQSAKWPIRTLFVDLRDALPCQPGQDQDERSKNDLFSCFFAQVKKERNHEIGTMIDFLEPSNTS